jgi:hypothetical protein
MAKEESGTKGVVDTRSTPGVGTSLDELAKGLASGTVSRGKALRWMGGALVGAALASVPGMAWAEGGRCSTGQTRCNDRCVNLQTNRNHCGSCRNRCASNQTCCKGRCVNLQRNVRHCGTCLHRCEEGEECVNGVCQGGGGCTGGTTPCGTQCCQPGETCLQGLACCPTAQVCGTGTSAICCPPAASCVNGLCECDDPGALACGDQCVGCEGGTVNSETCLCECPIGHTLCGTGTSATCCPSGQECADGVCR